MFLGKSSINGSFSAVILVSWRVNIAIFLRGAQVTAWLWWTPWGQDSKPPVDLPGEAMGVLGLRDWTIQNLLILPHVFFWWFWELPKRVKHGDWWLYNIYKHSKDQRLICPMGLWDLTLKPLSWERTLARQRRGFNQELNNKDWGKKAVLGIVAYCALL